MRRCGCGGWPWERGNWQPGKEHGCVEESAAMDGLGGALAYARGLLAEGARPRAVAGHVCRQ